MPSLRRRTIAIDTECTGVDLHYGARPYYVTTCDEGGVQRAWHWRVDPLTRAVAAPPEEAREVQACVDAADEVAMHNARYDVAALAGVDVVVPWSKVRCTYTCSHLLGSNNLHNLTDAVGDRLSKDVAKQMLAVEARVRDVTKLCRSAAKRDAWAHVGLRTSGWRLAEEGLPDMPSVGSGDEEDDKPWKADMWLPQAVADAIMALGVDLADAGFDESWLDALPGYGLMDPAVTLPLWLWMRDEVARRRLGRIFAERMHLPRIACKMELNGTTNIESETDVMTAEYTAAVDLAQAECLAVAEQFDFDLELPDGAGRNDSLREFVWGSVRLECPRCSAQYVHKHWADGRLNGEVPPCRRCLARKGRKTKRGLVGGPVRVECVAVENPCLSLPVILSAKTGNATLDAGAMEQYLQTLDDGPALDFVTSLYGMGGRQTALSYMRGYVRYRRPTAHPGWYKLHPSVNPTGTRHLRWSHKHPNSANISKKEDFNLRRCFGPMPGREWWSMDFKSIERRLPVYECREPKMLEVFEHPDKPPYWGNLYCLTASVLYPDEYWPRAQDEGRFKRECPALYKRAKFFDLAKQYGCGRAKADLLSRVAGSYDMVDNSFPLFAKLQKYYLDFARRYGYVETIPDRTVDPDRGYPILVSRDERGDVSTTTPFNYHVSGTAMQCTNRAMVETDARVEEWNDDGWDGFLTLQVHDELVWDCPAGSGDKPWEYNLWRMDELKALMESVGDGIGIATPVSREYHAVSYAVGMPV